MCVFRVPARPAHTDEPVWRDRIYKPSTHGPKGLKGRSLKRISMKHEVSPSKCRRPFIHPLSTSAHPGLE